MPMRRIPGEEGNIEQPKLCGFGLMSSRGDLDNYSADSFPIKIGCFGHLNDEVRLQIIANDRCRLLRVRSHSELMAERVFDEGDHFPEEKRFALLALQYRRTVTQTEIDWADSALWKSASGPQPVESRAD